MADPKDIKEAKRMQALFKKLGGEMAKRPGLMKAGKAGIKVADLFAPIPGGKARTAIRLANDGTKVLRKLMARRAKAAARNEAEKAALAAGGLGAATALTRKKNKKK